MLRQRINKKRKIIVEKKIKKKTGDNK